MEVIATARGYDSKAGRIIEPGEKFEAPIAPVVEPVKDAEGKVVGYQPVKGPDGKIKTRIVESSNWYEPVEPEAKDAKPKGKSAPKDDLT